MSDRADLSTCQRRMVSTWFIGGGVGFLLMIVLSLSGAFGGQTAKAWSWFIPNILPTLSLIAGALVHDRALAPPPNATVDGTLFRVSHGLSVFYFVVLLLPLLARPPLTNLGPIAALLVSNFWLVPLQGLVGAVLAAFFVSRKE